MKLDHSRLSVYNNFPVKKQAPIRRRSCAASITRSLIQGSSNTEYHKKRSRSVRGEISSRVDSLGRHRAKLLHQLVISLEREISCVTAHPLAADPARAKQGGLSGRIYYMSGECNRGTRRLCEGKVSGMLHEVRTGHELSYSTTKIMWFLGEMVPREHILSRRRNSAEITYLPRFRAEQSATTIRHFCGVHYFYSANR